MKIGILSDTHGLLRPEVLETLEGCELILHAGDIHRQEVLDRLQSIAPVRVVRGNNDKEWAEDIPYTLEFELDGLRICMAHKKKDLPDDLAPFDLAVTGHTHRYQHTRKGDTVFLNPGSCGPRLFHQPITLALAELEKGTLKVSKIDIPHS